MKIQPVDTELLHTDRQTDIRKLTVAFHSFTNVPKESLTDRQTDIRKLTVAFYSFTNVPKKSLTRIDYT